MNLLTDLKPQGIAEITLNRPERHNAFDELLIADLTAAVKGFSADPAVRVIVLRGAGASFSAGGDLNWMQRMAGFTHAQNRQDALALAELLAALSESPKPTIASVQGNIFGGGVGLVAACDIAIAAPNSIFCLPEARLGLVAAVISPYIVAAMSIRAARRYFLTGERFTAEAALHCGLVHEVGEAESALQPLLKNILQNSPQALAVGKKLLRHVAHAPIDAALVAHTADILADARASEDGREGIAAFLQKRKPAWASGGSQGGA